MSVSDFVDSFNTFVYYLVIIHFLLIMLRICKFLLLTD